MSTMLLIVSACGPERRAKSRAGCSVDADCALGTVCSVDRKCLVAACELCADGQICYRTTARPAGSCSKPECSTKSQCGGGECIEGQCQDASTNNGQNVCDTDTPCAQGVCHPSLGECVQCATSTDCSGSAQCIDTRCVQTVACINSLDCALDQVCDPGAGHCVDCVDNEDCGADGVCRANQCHLSVTCASDLECKDFGLLCDRSAGECVQCLQHVDCPQANHCAAGQCVPDVCSPGQSRCEGKTIQTCNSAGDGYSNGQTCSEQCVQGSCQQAGCPLAVAEGRVVGTTSYSRQIAALLNDIVELSGTKSRDIANGQMHRYEWSVIGRPVGSNSSLTSHTSANPRLLLDAIGSYQIELVVYDDEIQSCESSIVHVTVSSDNEILVQLVWTTPASSTGVGADLDLHYLHPIGKWNTEPHSVYWKYRLATWGVEPNLSVASLDIDSVDGRGPEVISHTNPAPNLTYAVGVHYYDAKGFGLSNATVRIFVNGVLLIEIADRQLPSTGTFWYVGAIQWPGGNFVNRDTLQEGFPGQ
ncbi:MAG: hypothetical protein H0U74_22065 [Bradymonadaceae bacterium]|nr:hypothetical protein [Lujinxingiaceae bacterium]